MYSKAEQAMVDILKDYLNNESLAEIDGRTMAAAFRRIIRQMTMMAFL
ncbi:MAG: hypothetical protein HFH75_07830 [Lachnospiraceae bacterium]|jgi:hypothetical protein|nr:hypothetical protein [Lachnospiraceae bacterium]